MRLATVQALSALGALAVVDAIPLKRSFLNLSAQETSSPKSLQEILDEKCKVNGEEACNVKNLTHYCGAKMYARKDLGTASQQAKVWRCYAETSLHMDVSGENCVDDCGNMKSCLGAVVGSSTAHLSYTAQLEALIDENRKTDCSTEEPVVEELTVEEARSSTSSPESLQDILDEKCRVDGEEACNSMNLVDFCGAEVYARKDLGTASQQVKAWRCYTRSALNMKMSGENCVDDCGNMKSCLGVVMGTSTSHMTRVAQLEALIADNRKTDCSTEQEVPEAGRLQKVLDARCLAKFAKMCSQNDAFCVYAVARKSGSWMCYPLSQLTLTGMSDSCVDDCGNTIPCEGELPENGSNILEAAELTEVVKDLKSGFCMMGENAA